MKKQDFTQIYLFPITRSYSGNEGEYYHTGRYVFIKYELIINNIIKNQYFLEQQCIRIPCAKPEIPTYGPLCIVPTSKFIENIFKVSCHIISVTFSMDPELK